MNIKTKMVSLGVLLSLITASYAFCQEDSLFSRYDGKTVKVFVATATDSSKDQSLDKAILKLKIEEALKDRKSIHFEIVPTRETSDITIETNIAGFMWTDHDPVDMLVGVGAVAMDTAMIEDYASMEADISVIDTPHKKTLWQKRVFATITKKPMSKEESKPLVSDNFAKAFIKNCFAKKRR